MCIAVQRWIINIRKFHPDRLRTGMFLAVMIFCRRVSSWMTKDSRLGFARVFRWGEEEKLMTDNQ